MAGRISLPTAFLILLAAGVGSLLWVTGESVEVIEQIRRRAEVFSAPTPRLVAALPAPAPARRMGEVLEPSASSQPWSDDAGSIDAPAYVEPRPGDLPPVYGEAARLANLAGEAINEHDYEGAAALLNDALDVAPQQPLLVHNLQMTYLNWGVATLNSGSAEAAVPLLEEADGLGPHPAVLHALGVAYLRQQRFADAARSLEGALALQPRDGQDMAMLAQAYAELDRRAEALDLVLRAREAGVDDPELDRLALKLSHEVDAEWDFVRSETNHFQIDYAGDTDRVLISEISSVLEDAYVTVGRALDYYPADKTRAVLYPQEDFHLVTQMPDWIGGLFDGRIKIPARGLGSGDDELLQVLRHEYAHRVINELTQHSCPVWLNEGVAMWAEGNPEIRQAWALREIAGRPLLDLTSIRGPLASLSKSNAQVAYAQSYLAVEHLAQRYGDRSIAALMHELGRRRDLAEAARVVLRTDLGAVLTTYFESL